MRTDVPKIHRAQAAHVREKANATVQRPTCATRRQDRHAAVAIQVLRVRAQLHEQQGDDGPHEAAALAEKRAPAMRVPHVPEGWVDPRAARGTTAPGAAGRRAAGPGVGRKIVIADGRLGRDVITNERVGRGATARGTVGGETQTVPSVWKGVGK